MNPSTALSAVVTQLTSAGLTEARSPLGVSRASSQRINRSFSAHPQSIGPSSSPGRGKPTTDGLRMEQQIRVEMGHTLKPGDGQAAPSQAMVDYQSAVKYLSATGTTLTQEGAVLFGTASHTYAGGGAFLVTSFTLRVIYEMDLS